MFFATKDAGRRNAIFEILPPFLFMARRLKNSDAEMSLFPFMSILAGLIGILTLMISVMMQVQQARQMQAQQVEEKQIEQMRLEGRSEEELALAIQNRELLKKITNLEKENQLNEEKLHTEKASVVEINKINDRVIALTNQLKVPKKAGSVKETDMMLQNKISNIENEITGLITDRPLLIKRLSQLKDEIEKRKETPTSDGSLLFQPPNSDDGEPASILFVQCDADGVVLLNHPDGPKRMMEPNYNPIGGARYSTASNLLTRSSYSEDLDLFKEAGGSMVVFLIRSNGASFYGIATAIARYNSQLKTERLILPDHWEIDLSLFKKN